jgi:hypothetical protein
MGRRGDAFVNALVESVISTIKNGLVRLQPLQDARPARLAVFDYRDLLQAKEAPQLARPSARRTSSRSWKNEKLAPLPSPTVSTETGSLYLTNADRPGQEVEVAPAQT